MKPQLVGRMTPKSYYTYLIFWVNNIIYMAYIIMKYVLPLTLWITTKWYKKSWCGKNVDKFMNWLVVLVFKKQLELELEPQDSGTTPHSADLRETSPSEGSHDEGQQSEESKDTSTPTADDVSSREQSDKMTDLEGSTGIQKQPSNEGSGTYKTREVKIDELTDHEWSTSVLAVLIFSFGLLAIGSALDVTLLSVSHVCSNDPNTDCYPQLIGGASDEGLNLTTDKPITDCAEWTQEDLSDRVTFVCYRFEFNVELFLAIVGGLSTVFVFTMKATIGIILYSLDKCGCKKADGCCSSKRTVRIFIVTILSLLELGLVVVVMVLAATGSRFDMTNDTVGVIFLTTHASEILLVFGIIFTLLWLPWESYEAKKQ